MGEHPNAKLIREGYQAFLAADMEWLNAHMHENIAWHEPGNNLLSGDYRGRESVLAFFAKIVTVLQPDFEVHDVVANEDHAIGLLSTKDTRRDNGETHEGRAIQVFHVDAEGQALEVWTFLEDQAGFDKFLEGAKD